MAPNQQDRPDWLIRRKTMLNPCATLPADRIEPRSFPFRLYLHAWRFSPPPLTLLPTLSSW